MDAMGSATPVRMALDEPKPKVSCIYVGIHVVIPSRKSPWNMLVNIISKRRRSADFVKEIAFPFCTVFAV